MSLRYTFVTVRANCNALTPKWFNEDMPIIASDELYNRMPQETGTQITLISGRQEGYSDITLFFSDVCTTLGFNPFKVADFQINSGGLASMEKDVIDAFMGTYEEFNNNTNYFWEYEDSHDDRHLGGRYLGSVDNQASYGQTTYTGSEYDTLFCNYIKLATFYSSNDGCTYQVEIWPEESISTGNISVNHFQRNNDNQIKTCHIFINIWKDANTNIYNFNVKLGGGFYTTKMTNRIDTYLDGADLGHIYNPSNPMDNKEQEGDEGGNGDWDNESDPIPVPDLPSIDITALGGLHLYKINASAFASLMSFMNSTEPGAAIAKWFINPIQAISACYILPYPIKGTSDTTVTLLGLPTTIAANACPPWTEWNLGSVYIKTRFGDCFLDYAPTTRVSLYLPFCGVKPLNTDDVIGHNVGIVYHFDNLSGTCVVYVTIDTNVKYTFSGSCAVGVPISQSNWGQTYIAAATAAAGFASGIVSGASGAIAAGGNMNTVIGNALTQGIRQSGGLSAFNAKPTISRSGSITGSAAALGYNKPFLIIERPVKTKMGDPTPLIGNTTSRIMPLGSLSGFTSIEQCHLHGITATAAELDEIERLLYEGVIL